MPIGDVNSNEKGSGARYNDGKVDYSLIPLCTMEDEARVWAYGRIKYAAFNWAKGMAWSIPFACLMRHMAAWQRGEENDAESGLPHLAHAMCNLRMLTLYAKTFKEGDDRPIKWFSEWNEVPKMEVQHPLPEKPEEGVRPSLQDLYDKMKDNPDIFKPKGEKMGWGDITSPNLPTKPWGAFPDWQRPMGLNPFGVAAGDLVSYQNPAPHAAVPLAPMGHGEVNIPSCFLPTNVAAESNNGVKWKITATNPEPGGRPWMEFKRGKVTDSKDYAVPFGTLSVAPRGKKPANVDTSDLAGFPSDGEAIRDHVYETGYYVEQ